MTGIEHEYVKKVLRAGLIQSPCLEMGVGYDGPNNKTLIQDNGITYYGTDMVAGQEVDYVIDFESSTAVIKKTLSNIENVGSILMCSILEHTFEPIKVLDSAFAILRTGGTCIITAPAVWPIHNYPLDCYRFNSNFFEEYSKRRSFCLVKEYFEYIDICKVNDLVNSAGEYSLPKPYVKKRFKRGLSRLIHRVFNTYGRGMFFPSHIMLGVVIKKIHCPNYY